MIKKPYLLLAILAAAAVAIYAFYRPTQEPGSGPAMVNVTVPELTETAKQGQQLFNANCAQCHGRNAAGQNGVAPPLVHKFYEPSHHGDISFHRAAKFGVRAHHWRFGNMPPVEGIKDDDVSKIVAYVRELQRANGIH
jgi:mono/diheme cytochrome c family protein